MGIYPAGFYTVYVFGTNYDKLKFSSCRLMNRDAAYAWADFLNDIEEDKPKRRRKQHFAIEIQGEKDEGI